MQLPPGFTGQEQPGDEELAVKVLRQAFDLGVTLVNTADFYGPFSNHRQIGKAIKGLPRDKVVIASKWGPAWKEDKGLLPDHSPETCRQRVEDSLERLGVDYLDVLILRSKNPEIPIEESVKAMAELVKEGKVKALGLSEISPSDIRKAHAVHPISVMELEWSLMSRDVEEDVVPICRELGIAFLAYSPLGRGVLSGAIQAASDVEGVLAHMPRLQGEALQQNIKLAEGLKSIAAKKGCTAAQLALAWVHHQGEDVFPIPGTKTASRVVENVGAFQVQLTKEDLAELEAAVPHDKVVGDRYPAQHLTYHYDKA
jgi:aryl-alcohol dehydrogenase-like predicted oxidoreductase